MNSLKYKNCLISLVFLFVITFSFGQIKVSELIQESKIATTDNNKLYFVDFWATWCGPCIHAKKHLGVIQRQFPQDFYIISLSEESPSTVDRFLSKKPTELAVALDYYGETFNRFNINSLPEGILFNAKGDKLWEGSPGDLNSSVINRFLRQEKSRISLDEFLNIVEIKEVKEEEYLPSLDIEVKLLPVLATDLQVVDNDKYLKLKGPLKSIIGYLAKIYKNQINISSSINKSYEVYFKKPYYETDNLAYKLVTEMGYKVNRQISKGEVISFELLEPKFWETDIIDWGLENNNYLIGDSDIKADNVTLKDMAYKMAYVLNMPVIIIEEDGRSLVKHDWEMHYKFFQLMQSSLNDTYGIEVQKKIMDFPIYEIIEK